MRLTPSTETVPSSVNRFLLPHERQAISVHPHPAVLLGPLGAAVGGFIAAAVLSGVADLSGEALLIMWLIWALLTLYALLKIYGWLVNYLVVTSLRILVTKGIFARDVAMTPLSQVANLRFRRTTIGRILGYGQFILEAAEQDPAIRKINYIPYPEQIYLEVISLVLPDPDAESD